MELTIQDLLQLNAEGGSLTWGPKRSLNEAHRMLEFSSKQQAILWTPPCLLTSKLRSPILTALPCRSDDKWDDRCIESAFSIAEASVQYNKSPVASLLRLCQAETSSCQGQLGSWLCRKSYVSLDNKDEIDWLGICDELRTAETLEVWAQGHTCRWLLFPHKVPQDCQSSIFPSFAARENRLKTLTSVSARHTLLLLHPWAPSICVIQHSFRKWATYRIFCWNILGDCLAVQHSYPD